MNKQTLIVLFLILFVSHAFPQVAMKTGMYCPTSNAKAEKYFKSGENALNNGNLQKASDNFVKAIEEDSLFCDAWDNLAVVMRRAGKNEKAKSYYFKAMNINKYDIVAPINFGGILLEEGDYEYAHKLFMVVTFIDSTNPEGYFGKAKAYYGGGNYNEALKNLNTAIELYTNQRVQIGHEVRLLEGLIYYGTGDIPTAKKILENEYENFANHPHMNYYLGLCYLNMETPNKDLARKYIKKAEKEGFTVDKEVLDKLEK